ncbi:MAG: uracil phosphoribosyltransferase [Flavobacteriales bacterium]|nr:uracil phosphoribosyltransferase [Flavobacteriales bacterium]MCB9166060.1 uracil phosphoribosyltransferase [Flavobacteriales bacterium]
MVVELSKEKSVVNQFLRELRDVEVQSDRMRFRRNLERVGGMMAYEISKTLKYEEKEVTTPLGSTRVPVMAEQPVIATILRAGIPMHQGMMNVFDGADSAFISAYRKHRKGEEGFDIEVEYLSSPSLDDRIVILCDPMLATGQSMVLVHRALQRHGRPKALHVASVIASTEGVEHIKKHLPPTTRIWVGAIDEEMTAQAYIVPGLGDAGDLAYGPKI